MYEKGQGVPKDDAEAVKWYRKAAEQGNAGAQDKLGAMYADGRGVPKDDAEAVRWHRMAAEQRDEDAQAIQNMFKMLEKFRAAP
jgi:TPR repeat protein